MIHTLQLSHRWCKARPRNGPNTFSRHQGSTWGLLAWQQVRLRKWSTGNNSFIFIPSTHPLCLGGELSTFQSSVKSKERETHIHTTAWLGKNTLWTQSCQHIRYCCAVSYPHVVYTCVMLATDNYVAFSVSYILRVDTKQRAFIPIQYMKDRSCECPLVSVLRMGFSFLNERSIYI